MVRTLSSKIFITEIYSSDSPNLSLFLLPLLASDLLILIFVVFLQALSACFHHLSSSNLGDLNQRYADDSHIVSSWNSLFTPQEDNQPHYITRPLYINIQKASQAKHTQKQTLNFPSSIFPPKLCSSHTLTAQGKNLAFFHTLDWICPHILVSIDTLTLNTPQLLTIFLVRDTTMSPLKCWRSFLTSLSASTVVSCNQFSMPSSQRDLLNTNQNLSLWPSNPSGFPFSNGKKSKLFSTTRSIPISEIHFLPYSPLWHSLFHAQTISISWCL